MSESSRFYESLLNLQGLVVDEVSIEESKLEIHCHTDSQDSTCPVCGQLTNRVNQTSTHIIQDLSISNRAVYLHLRVKQYVCKDCNRYFTEEVSFASLGKSYTKRLAKMIFDLGLQTSSTALASRFNIHSRTILRIILSYCESNLELSSRYKRVRRLGIDELSNKKGKQDFICVLTDLDTGEHLDLLKDRKKATLIAHFKGLGEQFCNQITDVCCDMWEPFIQVAKECFPNARLVIDRFHFTQALNDCLDKLRKSLRKTAPKEQAYKKLKWVLFRQYHKLTEKQFDALGEAFKLSEQLKEVYFLREQFHHILDNHQQVEQAEKALDKWIEKVEDKQPEVFAAFLNTLRAKKDIILNYVKDKLSNAATEGLNNLIRQIKRATWGMPSFHNLRLRVLMANH